jgi:spoIIIJ-associated protein
VAHAEASAKTVEAAVAAAASQLGLRPDEVEVELLEEPVPTTFGVIGRPARVRVTPRAPGSEPRAVAVATASPIRTLDPAPALAPAITVSASPVAGGAQRREHRDEPLDPELVEADTERAADFLEGLLDALDIDGDLTTWTDEIGGHVDLEGPDLDALVGSNGETLDALQELTRLAVLRQTRRRARVLLDVNGFRSRRRADLIAAATTAAQQVLQTREDHELRPMSPAERKIVHDAVAEIEGTRTESLGEGPNRRVVIRPA